MDGSVTLYWCMCPRKPGALVMVAGGMKVHTYGMETSLEVYKLLQICATPKNFTQV